MEDVAACYALDRNGRLLGANYGKIIVDEKLKADFSEVASVVWGSLKRVTNLGGPIRRVVATFENLKIVGLPIEGTHLALLLTVEVKIDSDVLVDRVRGFASQWLKVNDYVG